MHITFRIASTTLLGLSLILAGCGSRAGGVDIWNAVERGDVAAIERFAKAGGNLDVRSRGGSTPLWVALTEKNRYSYEALLESGADPNVIMSGRRVVTHWAAMEDDSWWLRLALEHEADPNLVNVGSGPASEGHPLKFAIGRSNLKNVKLLVEHGAVLNKPDRYNCHPLAAAVQQNDFEIVLYLLESGADFRSAECRRTSFLDWIRPRVEWRNRGQFMFQFEENRKSFDAILAWLKERGVDMDED